MKWFRFYNEALDDPKVQRLPAPLFRTWVNVLCVASRYDGHLPPNEVMAFALRVDAESVADALADLERNGLIDRTETGLMPHNWDGRQPPSDKPGAVAERKRLQRERDRAVTEEGPQGDEDAQSRQSHSDNAVTERDMSQKMSRPRVETKEEREKTETYEGARARDAADAAAPPKPPVPLKPSAPPKKPAAEQATPEGYALLADICEVTNAAPRGDQRRRDALHADELLRRCGGDATEAVAYVQFRLNRGDSPQLQFAAKDYAPGWRKKAELARASPNGRPRVSTADDFAAYALRLEAEERRA